jgi:FtsP/CotA-like multicopper oxidase with cupredoxin domain
MTLSRRAFLSGTAGLVLAGTLPSSGGAADGMKTLRLASRQVEIAGKAATRYGIFDSSGTFGLTLDEGDIFNVRLENGLGVPTGIHWHGMTCPWRQDGVPYVSQAPIPPGGRYDYKFPATPSGTRFMHAHFGLQEQDLLAAPLIIREASLKGRDLQEVVVLLGDFSWKPPQEIFDGLRKPPGGMAAMHMDHGGPDLNDVDYDAYLANDRTLDDPAVIPVERGGRVRLRLINGGASTNFTVDLGPISASLVAVDGNPIVPFDASRFPLGIAQRADIEFTLPGGGQAVPVLALGEGTPMRAGIILKPAGASVSRIPVEGETAGPVVGLEQERMLKASVPLPARPIERSIPVELDGTMMGYRWSMPIDGMGGLPATVGQGERVELVFRNITPMSHPMHLHGHVFQVTEINGSTLRGAMRDTIMVPPEATVKVVFDADNPGLWAFHCHNLYHMAAGMFSTLVYRGFS